MSCDWKSFVKSYFSMTNWWPSRFLSLHISDGRSWKTWSVLFREDLHQSMVWLLYAIIILYFNKRLSGIFFNRCGYCDKTKSWCCFAHHWGPVTQYWTEHMSLLLNHLSRSKYLIKLWGSKTWVLLVKACLCHIFNLGVLVWRCPSIWPKGTSWGEDDESRAYA